MGSDGLEPGKAASLCAPNQRSSCMEFLVFNLDLLGIFVGNLE